MSSQQPHRRTGPCVVAFVCLCLLGLVAPVVWSAQEAALFVAPNGDDRNAGTQDAPFRTIQRAQTAVRVAAPTMVSDITVYIRAGIYSLQEPLRFDHRDSGEQGFVVTYRAFPGERVILNGGARLTDWTAVTQDLYRASTGGHRFRQLYVNGVRAVRARFPNVPELARLVRWDEEARTIIVPTESLPKDIDTGALELVLLKEWTQDTVRVATLTSSAEGLVVVPREPDRSKTFLGHRELRYDKESVLFENALALLDVPGEWFADESAAQVYYRPRSGESLESATVMVPVLDRLLEVRGTAREPVHHLRFEQLGFEYAGWLQPSEEGFATRQADVLLSIGPDAGSARVRAAVFIEHAHDLVLERNTFRHLGATALALHTGVSESRVVGNRFEDLSGSAIVIDGVLQRGVLDPRSRCERIEVRNNWIEHIGLDYRSSVGIFAGYVAETTIAHNVLRDVSYTGISVGWGWTYDPNAMRNNRIAWNRLDRVMTTMADGAGIYTLSNQPGTVIQGNYVHDVTTSPWAGHSPIPGIYLDEGSSGMLVADNVLERVPRGLFFHRASHNRVRNTAGTYKEENGAADNVLEEGASFTPDEIRQRAGLEPAFADIGGR